MEQDAETAVRETNPGSFVELGKQKKDLQLLNDIFCAKMRLKKNGMPA